jgi:putative ATP-dependent endonuclease of OLD family
VHGYRLESRDIELVCAGTSFYPFLLLFNSTDPQRRLSRKLVVVTDDDRFADSKGAKYSFDRLIANDYVLLDELHEEIKNGAPSSRLENLQAFRSGSANIEILIAYKTLEYEIVLSNVAREKTNFNDNLLVQFLRTSDSEKFQNIDRYLEKIGSLLLSDNDQGKLAILIWKTMRSKAVFAQEFSSYLMDNLDSAKTAFVVPTYIKNALDHVS